MNWLALFLSLSLVPLDMPAFILNHKVIQKDLKASVLLHTKVIEIKDGKPEAHYFGCSGTFITPYVILTAGHCVSVGAKTWARGPNETIGYPVHLIALDRAKDLAAYEVPFRHAYVKLGPMPERGDKVLNIGSPMEFEFVPSEGIVGMTELPFPGFTSRYLVTTAMANPGSSGGGAFNEKGQLIGVNTMIVGMFGWQDITLTVNVNSMHEFIEKELWWFTPQAEERKD